MIDVGVTKNNRVNLPGVKGKPTISLPCFLASPLIHSAVEQDAPILEIDEVHRTGHCSGRSPKRDRRLSSRCL
jgi:hypothetical protein